MLIVGNWKMNLQVTQIYDLVTALAPIPTKNQIVLCPPAPYLSFVVHLAAITDMKVGGQTCSAYEKGAYTGDVSAAMLRDVGCSYVILGHSECRQYFGDTNALIRQKAEQAYHQNLKVIYCIGETLEQREAGQTLTVLESQLSEGLPEIANPDNTIIAYEPIWAIGTGRAATQKDVQEICDQLSRSHAFQILYGGSVNEQNAQELRSTQGLSGFLIGGASIKADSFAKIISHCTLS